MGVGGEGSRAKVPTGAAGPIKSLLVVFRPAEFPPAAAALDCFPINV